MELVFASRNRHKYRELKAIIPKGFELLSLADFPNYYSPEETGSTFEENAIAKAVHAASSLHLLTIADDSGLVVPALNGLPGVRSKRFASENATDLENRKKLLKSMSHLSGRARDAHFVCSIAVAGPQGLLKVSTASCYGTIALEEMGSNGFGYDALFIKSNYSKSFAQLTELVKNQVSHRAKALEKLALFLESLTIEEKNSGISCTYEFE